MDTVLKEIIEHNKQLLGGDVLLEVVAFDVTDHDKLDFTDGIYILNNKDADSVYGTTDHNIGFLMVSLGKMTSFSYDEINRSKNFYNIAYTGKSHIVSVGLSQNADKVHLEFIKLTPIVKKQKK